MNDEVPDFIPDDIQRLGRIGLHSDIVLELGVFIATMDNIMQHYGVDDPDYREFVAMLRDLLDKAGAGDFRSYRVLVQIIEDDTLMEVAKDVVEAAKYPE